MVWLWRGKRSGGADDTAFQQVAFEASPTPDGAGGGGGARDSLYGAADPEEADVIVALGGDGLMLQSLHRTWGPASRSTA